MSLVIAEIGINHGGDMGLATDMIVAAKKAGADIAKFQVYGTSDEWPSPDVPWWHYIHRAELTFYDVRRLAAVCRDSGIEFMATPFQPDRVEWLEDVGVKRYKIASRSVYNIPVLSAVASTGKDVIISLGMWEDPGFPQIDTTGNIFYLHCISKYPATLEEAGLENVDFKHDFNGYSDHVPGIEACIKAIDLGARIIEKHFTLDKYAFGPDHNLSATADELKEIVAHSKKVKV